MSSVPGPTRSGNRRRSTSTTPAVSSTDRVVWVRYASGVSTGRSSRSAAASDSTTMVRVRRLALGALHLLVVGVPDQQQGPAVAGEPAGLLVRLRDQRAGRVDHPQLPAGGGARTAGRRRARRRRRPRRAGPPPRSRRRPRRGGGAPTRRTRCARSPCGRRPAARAGSAPAPPPRSPGARRRRSRAARPARRRRRPPGRARPRAAGSLWLVGHILFPSIRHRPAAPHSVIPPDAGRRPIGLSSIDGEPVRTSRSAGCLSSGGPDLAMVIAMDPLGGGDLL